MVNDNRIKCCENNNLFIAIDKAQMPDLSLENIF